MNRRLAVLRFWSRSEFVIMLYLQQCTIRDTVCLLLHTSVDFREDGVALGGIQVLITLTYRQSDRPLVLAIKEITNHRIRKQTAT